MSPVSWWVIGVLAAGTFLIRVSGGLLRRRVHVPPRVVRLLGLAATALLLSLAVTTAVLDGSSFGGWARVLGVGAGLLALWRRAPFVVVVLVAAGTTALLRLAGVA
ncbi:AzlD domain-containing protein [Rhodococcus sp. X156]|uniref:AzlD domain-containing protein n=1 Tax=Rhodococcus sp. X156 TaxID=2499145 RepID=UPI000FDA73A8|nr:AzlD domain-containing protein [Rhodococcus sp. X156]